MTREESLKQAIEEACHYPDRLMFKTAASVVLSTPSILQHVDPEIMKQAGWVREDDFQEKVNSFVIKCFGEEVAKNKVERAHRFLEESLELSQAIGCKKEDAYTLVDYVFSRPIGDISKEVGGVMVTLAALCNATKISINNESNIEIERCFSIIDKIRQKWLTKPKNSPLPQPPKQ